MEEPDGFSVNERDVEIIKRYDRPGDAAQKIAEERGISFLSACSIVSKWMIANGRWER